MDKVLKVAVAVYRGRGRGMGLVLRFSVLGMRVVMGVPVVGIERRHSYRMIKFYACNFDF